MRGKEENRFTKRLYLIYIKEKKRIEYYSSDHMRHYIQNGVFFDRQPSILIIVLVTGKNG